MTDSRWQRGTYGGAGWQGRAQTHSDDLTEGNVWGRCGARSEVAALRRVLLFEPPLSLAQIEDPDAYLMLDRVDLDQIRTQTDAIEAFYAVQGAEVIRFRAPDEAPPNLIFARDLFFMTPEGAVLARPAAAQRAGEARFAAQALSEAGVPILRSVVGAATFEGADALWLDPDTVLVGVGRRTNWEGYRTLREVLVRQGVEAIAVDVPRGSQHLLGVVNFIDEDLAAVWSERLPRVVRGFLAGRGVSLIECATDDEFLVGRGMNFVTVGPRALVMPAGCPGMQARFEAAGVTVHTLDISEYLKAAGGLGCLTGIVHR